MQDNQLIHLLKNAPSEGLKTAIDLYGGLVKWVVVKIIGNQQEDIEECVSDTFLRLWQSIDRFDPTKNITLKSYLCGIARHTALDYRRKLQRTNELIPYEEAVLDWEVMPQEDISAQVSDHINAQLIQTAIDQLPPPDKEIFIYRYYFYNKVADIAERLSLDQKTVENKLYRNKKKLKDFLLKKGVIL